MRGLVTTAPSGDLAEAEEIAGRCGLTAEAREGRTLSELCAAAGGAPVLVLSSGRADLLLDGALVRASPGMGLLRLARAWRGEVDPLVGAARLRPGDRVLDATLGLGGDALAAAHATQREVVALEAAPVLCAFTLASLRRLGPPAELVDVRCENHGPFLRAAPARSFDVVLFDPMFRRPAAAASLFAVVRALGTHAPLREEDLVRARQVARRGVLVKNGPGGAELRRLGLAPVAARRSARFLFGWADARE